MQQKPVIEALSATPIGRALLAYWSDLPLWVLANGIFAVSLLPSFTAWLIGSIPLTILLSFPAVLVSAGVTNSLAQTIEDRAVRWRDLLHGPRRVALTLWVILALLALSFLFETPTIVFAVQCLMAVVVLMLSPFVICVSVLYPTNIPLAWRNAFVCTVHFPLVALGLVALALVLGWLVILSKGALLLIAPSLWLCITMYSAYEIMGLMRQSYGS